MIYLKLFLTFLEIGAVSFGGGYGMISLIREAVISNKWLTEDTFTNLIAVSESTPGPIAVNIATFIGSSQAGILGSFLATLGVILPAFIIILIIASFIKNLMKFSGVNAFMSGIRPCVVALILSTVIIMGVKEFIGITKINDHLIIDIKSVIIFIILIIAGLLSRFAFKKKPSPIIMILLSAGLGIIFY